MLNLVLLASPSCEEKEASEKFKTKNMSSTGFEQTTFRTESSKLVP